jgi:hypothetical protein
MDGHYDTCGYIIAPFTTRGRLVLNKHHTPASKLLPQCSLDFNIEPIACTLSRQQYLTAINHFQLFAWLALQARFHELRPVNTVRGHARDWWLFATDAVLVEYRRRTKAWSWANMRERMVQRKQYVSIFLKFLQNPNDAIRASLEENEKLLSVCLQSKYLNIIRHELILSLKFYIDNIPIYAYLSAGYGYYPVPQHCSGSP